MLANGIVVGLTSFGEGCAVEGIPGVYARVSAAQDFIRHGICQLSNYPPDWCAEFSGTVAPIQVGAESMCFSERATVLVQGKGTTRMDQLQIDDMVLAMDGTYTRVYSFGHLDRQRNNEFLHITMVGKHEPLEITADHLLFVDQVGLVPAGRIKVGALLVTSAIDLNSTAEVCTVRKVHRKGMYAPFTVSGSIVVNGVAASNYIALPPVFQSHFSFEEQHWLQHAAFFPYRLFCDLVGCTGENYDKVTGLSNAVTVWLPLLHWHEKHHHCGQVSLRILVLLAATIRIIQRLDLLLAVIMSFLAWLCWKHSGVNITKI